MVGLKNGVEYKYIYLKNKKWHNKIINNKTTITIIIGKNKPLGNFIFPWPWRKSPFQSPSKKPPSTYFIVPFPFLHHHIPVPVYPYPLVRLH
jgi:hypothetical protein